MPVNHHWYKSEKKVIYLTFTNSWTVQELADCEASARELIVDFDYSVDAIYDIRDVKVVPNKILSYLIRSLMVGESRHNEGINITLGASPLAVAIIKTVQRLVKTDSIYFADTIEQVDEILENMQEPQQQKLTR